MEIEITREMLDGYVAAVAAALEAAGRKVEVPAQEYTDEMQAEIVLPDALTDGYEPAGLVLQYDYDGSWVAGQDAAGWVVALYLPKEPGRRTMHTALYLGAVPEPDAVVRSVAAIVADGGLRAGRIVPGTAELLAQYEKTPAWVSTAWTDTEVAEALTGGDQDWQFTWCVVCGSEDVVAFALVQPEGHRVLHRVAWCRARRCQDDRVLPSRMPQFRVERGVDGVFRILGPVMRRGR